jgi:hypothetical protein
MLITLDVYSGFEIGDLGHGGNVNILKRIEYHVVGNRGTYV